MASQSQLKKQQDLQTTYQTHKSTLQSLAQKIGAIEQETEEHKFRPPPNMQNEKKKRKIEKLTTPLSKHRLVLETLAPLPPTRTCFRMINGVLTQRTVSEVVPLLQTNAEGLERALGELVRVYKGKQEEMEMWKVKNNVQVVQQPE
ncbi:hypothetical protein BDU57DRAFT_358687 [Ampelomyces quisqualis]|uniref:Prefoldin beta-like protein n=1 Tax=Ampelomyces quisqualis TaxID=50730 RepID=A0A6A5QA87_AMPQU|nr:hypothetical protein BDU57DRAFT_358687 [Ampelomyces quisqualis]